MITPTITQSLIITSSPVSGRLGVLCLLQSDQVACRLWQAQLLESRDMSQGQQSAQQNLKHNLMCVILWLLLAAVLLRSLVVVAFPASCLKIHEQRAAERSANSEAHPPSICYPLVIAWCSPVETIGGCGIHSFLSHDT